MTQLGMNLTDVCTPVTKANFKKWHSEGALLLLDAGIGQLDILLSRLNDISIDRRSQGRQVTTATVDGSHNQIVMFSNGVEEFVIVISDMTTDTERKHLTVYVVND